MQTSLQFDGRLLKVTYSATENFKGGNTLLEEFSVADRAAICAGKTQEKNAFTQDALKEAWINPGGWQSWAPGFEIGPREKRPVLYCSIIEQWTPYISVPGTPKKTLHDKKIILAQFVSYFRIGENYFFMISTGSVNREKILAPLQFEIDRKTFKVRVTAIDGGKEYNTGDEIAGAAFFTASSFFEARKVIESIFGSSDPSSKNYSKRFDAYKFLGENPRGWESWYNHYTSINEVIIMDALKSLGTTENLISMEENSRPVFQIDDGWEKGLGDWEWNEKFQSSPKVIASLIEEKGFVPGLWIAPFILDYRSSLAKEHSDWILRSSNGEPVYAGYNPAWGGKKGLNQPYKNYTFFALDLSRHDVLEFLDTLMEKAVDRWGFRYLKLDFLYAGMLYGNFSGRGAAFEHYDRAVKILTKRKTNAEGRPVTYLGCGMPCELSFNALALSRSGCDTREHWEERLMKFIGWNGRTSAYLNMKDSIGRALWNRTIYLNDPDVVFVRKNNCSLSHDEKILVSLTAILFGSQLMYSDDPAVSCGEEEVSIAREILDLRKKYSGIHFSATPLTRDVFEIVSEDKKHLGCLNLSEKEFRYKEKTVKKHSGIIFQTELLRR